MPSTERRARRSSVAGKIFVIGEYAVLDGLPAVVAAVGPRFTFQTQPGASLPFAGASPAGKLADFAKSRGMALPEASFEDPHAGRGGFGASTAQFALLYRALFPEERSWKPCWELYRELTASQLPPSGADLLTQWQGGVQCFESASAKVSDVSGDLDWSRLLVFSATAKPGRKTATHTHLDELSRSFNEHASERRAAFRSVLSIALSALKRHDLPLFGEALDEFAEVLARFELEAPSAREDRVALRALPGVIGVKGAGALQTDAMIALMDPQSTPAERGALVELAATRGLKLVDAGIPTQGGILDE
ncbi:MAG: hypothetical protein ACXWPM_07725 [Bdellovibrionota bacterium]